MAKVSVIVPIYNVENYIDKCIHSIISQTLKDIEILLIDDGSTDNSGKIADEYAKVENRIKVIHKQNGGVSSARNVGIEVATGEYIGFVDSDDWIEAEMYEMMYKKAKKSDADICRCKLHYSYTNKLAENTLDGFDNKDVFTSGYIARLIANKSFNLNDILPSSVCLCLFKKELLTNNNITFSLNLSYGEDMYFNIRATYYCKKLAACDNAYYHYIDNMSSVTRTYSQNLFDKILGCWSECRNFLRKNYSNEDIEDRLNMYLVDGANQSIINESKSDKDILCSFREICKICNNKDLQKALGTVILTGANIKEKLIVFLIKNKLIIFIYLYYFLIRKNVKAIKLTKQEIFIKKSISIRAFL